MIAETLRSILQLLYALLLLTLLSLYGCVRGVSHLLYRSRQRKASVANMQEDLKRWKKIPSHLAVCFVPSSSILFRQNRLEQLADDASHCIQWAMDSGMSRLSLFDPEGLMQQHAVIFKSLLRARNTELGIEDNSSRPNLSVERNKKTLEVSLVSSKDGKPAIADATKILAEAVNKNMLALEEIDVSLLNDKLYASTRSPQLMIVLGGRQLQLHSYPPWHIRLTEIYHEPSLDLLGPARLTYGTFKRAIDLFSGCEMRFGR